MTDEQIIESIQDGTVEECNAGLDAFFEQYGEKIKDSLRKKVTGAGGTVADAKDAYQEGFMIFLKNIQEGHFNHKGTLVGYFIGTAFKAWYYKRIKAFNKGAQFLELEEEFNDLMKIEPFEAQPLRFEIIEAIREVLEVLIKPCKDVLLIRYREGLKEVQEKMGFPNYNTARKRVQFCKKKFLEHLEENPDVLEKMALDPGRNLNRK